ncbi:radical SAM protein [Paenibacillus sinopodophylli]|uniref:radical SAM protein n=1 Tax=Paenibacillus sinopodophylli TaxID=1837342 RepID=UPI00110CC1F3|nr:radical SAM protein [Paenibacillus sinopodophylli]
MQPKSRVDMDEAKFQLLKRTIKNVALPYREKNKSLNAKYKTELPQSIGIKLTNRCNLRCIHCFQWNDEGYHHNMELAEQNRDLDIQIFKKILDETKSAKSRLYLWGGEPLFHKQFSEIADMMAEDPRETVICTNALLINKHMDSILKISENLDLLIAVEGFEKEHDLIRGKGTFKRTMDQIDQLLKLREEGLYKGRISIHTVINENLVDHMHDLLVFFEEKGIDLVILCFPWYISKDTSAAMDHYFKKNFSWLNKLDEQHISSWHAFKYQFNPNKLDALTNELTKINDRLWNIRVRYQPGLDFDELQEFIHGDVMTSRCGTNCLALSTRMDIAPDGKVMACKFFAEFSPGNLIDQGLKEVWDSETYDRIRDTINNGGLTPACSKCSVLYLHGI